MKCILVFALLFVSVYTAPINDEVDLLTVQFDPEDDCVAVLGKEVSKDLHYSLAEIYHVMPVSFYSIIIGLSFQSFQGYLD